MVKVIDGTTYYSGTHLDGSYEACVLAKCSNPHRWQSPCPATAAHDEPGGTTFKQPVNQPRWFNDPASSAQLDLLRELGGGLIYTEVELGGMTKKEASLAIGDLKLHPLTDAEMFQLV